jgi:serine/threonine-protein kinase HipA
MSQMALVEFAWHGDVIGTIDITPEGGMIWNGRNHPYPGLFDGESSRAMPTMLKHLAPEGWLREILESPDRAEYIQSGIRFLSNITIAENSHCIRQTVETDRVLVPLENCSSSGIYDGLYAGPCAKRLSDAFERNIAVYWKNKTMPKLSGAQMKLPVTLYSDADSRAILLPATSGPFSHLLKFPGKEFFESVSALEWMGLEMAEKAGLETCKHALINVSDDFPPALLVERFDIPHEDELHTKRFLIADFSTLTGLNPETAKYGTNAEVLAKRMLEISSDPEKDALNMFRRMAFAWFSGDGDMHIKNISMLKEVDPETKNIKIRMAPVYDTLPTVALPCKGDQTMAFRLGGKDRNFREANFIQFAQTLKIDTEVARIILKEVAENTAMAAVALAKDPPDLIARNERCSFALKHAATEIVDRVKAFGYEVPDWEPVRPDKKMRGDMRDFASRAGMTYTMA